MKKSTVAFLTILAGIVFLAACSSSLNNQASESETDTAGNYNFDKHDNIQVFMQDLALAVEKGDKESIAGMIDFPFTDEWGDYPDNQTFPLGCENSKQFLEKFDRIFTDGVKKAIAGQSYRGWTDNGNGTDVIAKGEYLIEGDGSIDGESDRPHVMLGIRLVSGKFKIYAVKFYS